MKTQALYIAGMLLLGATATSCRDERTLGEGDGRMMLSTTIVHDVKVVSRAEVTSEELASSALIWVSDLNKGQHLYTFEGYGSFPADGLRLNSGRYAVEAWAGDSIPASWDRKRYRGYQDFEITSGSQTQVELRCPIRNTVVTVTYGDKVAEVLEDYTLTVGLNDGITDGSHSLTFEGETDARGYYMINSRTRGFSWTLSGTEKSTGKKFVKEGVYTDPAFAGVTDDTHPLLAQTTNYVFNINYTYGNEIEIGGAYFDIEVEPEPVDGKDEEVLIALAPEIKGTDFDIAQTVMAEPAAAERLSLYVTTSSSLKEIVFESQALASINGITAYELLTTDHTASLAAAGINWITYAQDTDKSKITNMRINFEEQYLNSLPAGDYEFKVTATDEIDQTSTATLRVSLSSAPVMLGEATDVAYTTATIAATILKESATYGFEIKGGAYADWTAIEPVVNGTAMTAALTGLTDGTTYAYRAVADDFTTREQTFTTLAYPQFDNAGFEFSTTGQAVGTSKQTILFGDFWDSGNHGSATMDKTVTTLSSDVKHSGNYSICLESQFVGVGGFIGKFAAGNVFVGKYLKTDGTDGILGFGKPFPNLRPKALRGWVKYNPVAIDNVAKDAPAEYVKGNMDQAIIYVALLTDHQDTEWNVPVVIKTKAKDRQLFDKGAENVLAYGEKIFDATSGEAMIPFEIPIEHLRDGVVANIMCTISASKGGDYFTGGAGSTMWVDDLELVY